METCDRSVSPVEQWRAALRQPGIEGPVRELLEAASRNWAAPAWQPALQVWALLVSRVAVRDPGHRARAEEGALWDQLIALRGPLQDAWTGRRTDVGAERALALEVVECLLATPEACTRARGEPPMWLNLPAVALHLADVERQLGWQPAKGNAPTLIATTAVEMRDAGAGDGHSSVGERLTSEQWRATLRSLLPDLWRANRRRQEAASAAEKAGEAEAGAATIAAAAQEWDATMRLTGFTHIERLLEAGRRRAAPEWELALRVWIYLVARINEYIGPPPVPLPPDRELWDRLTAVHDPLQAAWADRTRGHEWERRQALDIARRLLTHQAACRRAGPPPSWLTIRTLAAAVEEAYDDLHRDEGQGRLTVMALHAVEAWRQERNDPQPNLRRPKWRTALRHIGNVLYHHLLLERAARRRELKRTPSPGAAPPGGPDTLMDAAGVADPSGEARRSGGGGNGADATSASDDDEEEEEAEESGRADGGADADALEHDDEGGGRRRREWRAILAQEGVRGPILGLLREAEAAAWTEAETTLRLWAYLASRVNVPLDEASTIRAPTFDAEFWSRLERARLCLLEAWAGRRTAVRVAAARAFFLRWTEFYLVQDEARRAELPEPPEWVTLAHLAADLTNLATELDTTAHVEPEDTARPPVVRIALESWAEELSDSEEGEEAEGGDSTPSPLEDAGSDPTPVAPRQVVLHRATLSCPVTVSWKGVVPSETATGDGYADSREEGQSRDAAAVLPSHSARIVPQLEGEEGSGKGEQAPTTTFRTEPGVLRGSAVTYPQRHEQSHQLQQPQQEQKEESFPVHNVEGAQEAESEPLCAFGKSPDGSAPAEEQRGEGWERRGMPAGSMEVEGAGEEDLAMETCDRSVSPVEQWRAALRQPGIEGPVRELLEAASRNWAAPAWQPALQVWALLVSRVAVRDPGHRARAEEGALWDQLIALRGPLQDAWTGRRTDVGAERALTLEVAECLLATPEACTRARGEPPTWLNLPAVALHLADVERQLGWQPAKGNAPTLIATTAVEMRDAGAGDGHSSVGERLTSEQWRATLRSLLPDLWRANRRRQEAASAAEKAGEAEAGAATIAAAAQEWDATMRLTGFTHIERLLEAGRRRAAPEWELALRVWIYLVARINEYIGPPPVPLPPDRELWDRLTAVHDPLQAAWADRTRGHEWERRQALDIARRLLTHQAACRRAGPPPSWLTIRTLAAAVEEAYDDLHRDEGQGRLTVMALHAVEAWRQERNDPQPNLRRPEWRTALRHIGNVLYHHLLLERAARRRELKRTPSPGAAPPGGPDTLMDAAGVADPSGEARRSGGGGNGADATSASDDDEEEEEAEESGRADGGADADALEHDDEGGGRRRREWRAILAQEGVRGPILGLLREAEAAAWTEAETTLRLWAYLASRVNVPLDEASTIRAPTFDAEFWSRLERARLCLLEAWAGRRTAVRVAAARAFFLRWTEFYLVQDEARRAELPEPPEWVTLAHLAADLTNLATELDTTAHVEPEDTARPPVVRIALESWAEEVHGPQRPLRARRWREQLHYLADLIALRPPQQGACGPSGAQPRMEWQG
ncbi:UNVERIFIED_CONTAM: hypothetical protein K2H54_002664 [Gekko kuhli]